MTNNTASDLVQLSASHLSTLIHSKQVSCLQVMQAFLTQIAQKNPAVNAIVSMRDQTELLKQAAQADQHLKEHGSMGWLHGLPIAIKDLAAAQGFATSMGSPLMQNSTAPIDALMVARIKAAGAIVIGKTNVPEFGLGSHSYNTVFGTTLNAFDPTKTAGGSSGGAAVALALNMLPIADGSDFMGSLRNPAAWNNIFGMRPSQGRVPMLPATDLYFSQLGTEGPMARTVQDLAQLLQTQSGFDARAPLSIRSTPAFTENLGNLSPRQLRIGWLGDLNAYLPVEPGILQSCELRLKQLADLGAVVEPIKPNFSPTDIWQTWLVLRRFSVAARIAPFLTNPSNRAKIKPEALWEHDCAAGLSAQAVSQASIDRSSFYQKMLSYFDHFDVIAMPVTQVWPFDATEHWPKSINGVAMDTYHRWMESVIYATLAGLPAISVPAGFGIPNGTSKPLPVGLQLIGKPQGDAQLLQVARLFEQIPPKQP
jgi:amidase